MKRWLAGLVAVLALSGCGPLSSETGGTVGYALPIVPLGVSYKYPPGQFAVSIGKDWATPIGTFSVSVESEYQRQAQDEGYQVLLIESGQEVTVFKLDQKTRYEVHLQNDYNGEAKVITLPEKHTIKIVIPHPTAMNASDYDKALDARNRENQNLRDQIKFQEQPPDPPPAPTHIETGLAYVSAIPDPDNAETIMFCDEAGRVLERHTQCNCSECHKARGEVVVGSEEEAG